ncbi:hypothetical protein [Salinibaculum rarum]|uniref:hypothetical protein n=1 Tax=Salinibaculum rarum TaxID=3058903 RepID=UPI00265FCAF1|nr:hypothetical protein [Salinibaculum sp. KK48]
MSDDSPPDTGGIDNTPTVTCARCDQSWRLDYELDDMQVGNQAVEQFALDHYRHTGHFPDDVTPWLVDCRHCPDGDQFLSEQPARRWAETHVRHTRHTVAVEAPTSAETELLAPDGE